MSHLIYDETEELIDVMDFDNIKALEAFKKSNPKYLVLATDELNDLSFVDEEEIDLDADEVPLW